MPERVLGIIGHPIAHSLSPLMHNFAAKELGLPYAYAAFDVDPAFLKQAVRGLAALGVAGFNVTVPHKIKIMKYLDGLDAAAKSFGAVNTVINKNGKLYGTNTDGIGFLRSLVKAKFRPEKKNAAVIGAGGSTRAIGACLLIAGIEKVTIVNRTRRRGTEMARMLGKYGEAVYAQNAGEAAAAIEAADLVVQTTSLGMKASDPLPSGAARFRKGQLVYDIIYSPRETRFLKAAGKQGAKTMNGLSMLVYQGSESFRLWTGKKFPEEKIVALLTNHLRGGK